MDSDLSDSPETLPNTDEAFSDLEMPDMTVKGLMSHFGPGVLLMMTGVGTSHLITAPTAGGRYAYALLWCIPVAYVFKYYGFEMAFRFTNATGKSMIEAYSTAWKKWPLWYVLITTLIQCALGQAGRLIAAAAVLYYVGSEVMGLPISLTMYGLILAVVSVAIILRGRYKRSSSLPRSSPRSSCSRRWQCSLPPLPRSPRWATSSWSRFRTGPG